MTRFGQIIVCAIAAAVVLWAAGRANPHARPVEPLQNTQQLEAMPPKSGGHTSNSARKTYTPREKRVRNTNTQEDIVQPARIETSVRGETHYSSKSPNLTIYAESAKESDPVGILSQDEWWTGMLDYILMRESSGGGRMPENPYGLTDAATIDMARLGIREPVLRDHADCRRAIRAWLEHYIEAWSVPIGRERDIAVVYKLYRGPGRFRREQQERNK